MLSGGEHATPGRKEGHSEVRCLQHGDSEMEPSVMQSGVEIGEGQSVVNARFTFKVSPSH